MTTFSASERKVLNEKEEERRERYRRESEGE